MEKYAVIVDNGGGPNNVYHDVVGVEYTFPKRYTNILLPGTKVIYFRSGKTKETENLERMMNDAHYFGTAEIGSIVPSVSDNFRASILNYKQFSFPVPFNVNGDRYETADGIFWMSGVRAIDSIAYNKIVEASKTAPEIKKKKKVGDKGKRTKTELSYGNESLEFAAGQFKIVIARDGYYLFSLFDHVFYHIKTLEQIKSQRGSIKIMESSKDPNSFLFRHSLDGLYEDIVIRLVNNGVYCDSKCIIKESIKMMV